jgi:hypothetical protein
MTRRARLAVTLVTLAMHLLAPIGAGAAVRPAVASGDYCSVAARSAADSGVPEPRPAHSPHSHCPSCAAVSLAVAIPAPGASLAVRLLVLVRLAAGTGRADIVSRFALLPPLRGPPPIFAQA